MPRGHVLSDLYRKVRNLLRKVGVLRNPTAEARAEAATRLRSAHGGVGALDLCITGAFVGYIQTICIDPSRRGQGLGSRLGGHSEFLLRKTVGPLTGFSSKD